MFVQYLKALSNLQNKWFCITEAKRALSSYQLRQALAIQQFHGQAGYDSRTRSGCTRRRAMFDEIEDTTQIIVGDTTCNHYLTLESLQATSLSQDCWPECLQSEPNFQPLVVRFVDFAHPTRSNESNNA